LLLVFFDVIPEKMIFDYVVFKHCIQLITFFEILKA